MKFERTKNATRNIAFGMVLKLYQILVPFFIRSAMIYWMGLEYVGLNSLFVSILQVLNLAELGVGNAMVFSMYRPIAEGDTKTICALMRLYKVYYRVIGIIVLAGGLIMLPFLPYLIKSGLPNDVNLYILYLLNLSATVLSYWLFAYKNSVLVAHQRTDVSSKILICISSVEYVFQFIAIIVFQNYYLYLIMRLLAQLLTNIVTAVFAEKMYPNYQPEGKLDKIITIDINKRIRDLFTAKLGGIVVNSSGTIVISSYLGLLILGIYNNYFYILTAVSSFVKVILSACTAGIGNSIVTETEEKNYNDLRKMTFIINWILAFSSCCMLSLYQPFMKIWVGEKAMFGFTAVVYLCLYYYLYNILQFLSNFKDAAGLWHKDRFRPLTVAGVTLILNLIFVQLWGVYGVLLSTIIATITVEVPWLIRNLFSELFKNSNGKKYVCDLLIYVGISIATCIAVYLICCFIPETMGVWCIILRGIICTALFNLVFLVLFFRNDLFKQTIAMVKNIIKK